MDSQDRQGAVSSVIKILRKATRIVQLAPFAYLVFFVVYLILGSFEPEGVGVWGGGIVMSDMNGVVRKITFD